MLKIWQAEGHPDQLILCMDDDEPDDGVIMIDDVATPYHTLATVTSEQQLQAVRVQYPHLPESFFDKYRLAAGLPLTSA